VELAEAEMIINLCQWFHCTPAEAMEMDADVIRMLNIYNRGRKEDMPESSEYDDYEAEEYY